MPRSQYGRGAVCTMRPRVRVRGPRGHVLVRERGADARGGRRRPTVRRDVPLPDVPEGLCRVRRVAAPSAQYSLTIRVEIEHRPGMLGGVATAIGQAGGTIGSVDLVMVDDAHTVRDITVDTPDAETWNAVLDAINSLPSARV